MHPITLLISLMTLSVSIASESLPDGRPDLQRLHDLRHYQQIHDFIDASGVFVLEDYYQSGRIDRQTLFDIAALTGSLDLFYQHSRVEEQENSDRTELMVALRYAQSEDPSAFRLFRPYLRSVTDEECESMKTDLFSTTKQEEQSETI